MTAYAEMTADELHALEASLRKEYDSFKAKGLSLNMARGKPSSAQLDLSRPMLDLVNSESDLTAEDGTDCRNYGVGVGLPEARELMATMLDDDPANVIVCGNSSLNIMYDTIMRNWALGTLGSEPWGKLPEVKWLCPVPGYDRHFAITEALGIKMINVPMDDNGPDMNVVESLVANDPNIKGMWCVPTYSNPSGCVYSDEVVRRLATMPVAADDFRIFWDNAYCVHHLYDEDQAHVLDIGRACADAGHPDRYYKFASTSKVTFPGAGISAIAASPANIAEIAKRMNVQTIGHDKLNQLRHVRFLKDAEGIAAHMKKHAALLRPKFELVEQMLSSNLSEVGCTWTTPKGGYFVCFTGLENTAKRTVELAHEAGVIMTAAGAPFPYGRDPHDSVIRIAPSLPPVEELKQALEVFVCCVKLASVEALLK